MNDKPHMDLDKITKALSHHRGVETMTPDQLIFTACNSFDPEKLIELGIADEMPLFKEGDKIRILTDLAGEDYEGREHHLSVAELAEKEATVNSVRFLRGGQGWQYNVSVQVRPGELDEDGDPFTIDGNFDNSDLVEGKMPLELFHGPEEAAAPRRKPGM